VARRVRPPGGRAHGSMADVWEIEFQVLARKTDGITLADFETLESQWTALMVDDIPWSSDHSTALVWTETHVREVFGIGSTEGVRLLSPKFGSNVLIQLQSASTVHSMFMKWWRGLAGNNSFMVYVEKVHSVRHQYDPLLSGVVSVRGTPSQVCLPRANLFVQCDSRCRCLWIHSFAVLSKVSANVARPTRTIPLAAGSLAVGPPVQRRQAAPRQAPSRTRPVARRRKVAPSRG
jgi:hypothetical protein